MPMKEGKTKKIMRENIQMLMHEGHDHKEAIMMAMDKAGINTKKKGKQKKIG